MKQKKFMFRLRSNLQDTQIQLSLEEYRFKLYMFTLYVEYVREWGETCNILKIGKTNIAQRYQDLRKNVRSA